MKKAEIIIATLSIIALVLNILLIPGAGVLTVLTLGTLSVIYVFLGFALFNDISISRFFTKNNHEEINTLKFLGAVGAGLAISLTVNGIMFKFQSWPMADFNLRAGLAGLLIVTIIGIIKYSKNKSEYYIRIFKRVAIWGGIGLILMLTPKKSYVEFKYRNHPAYVNAFKKAMDNPENKEFRDKVEIEKQKMKYEKEHE